LIFLLDENKLFQNIQDSKETEDDYLEIDESNIDILMDIEEDNILCNDNDLKSSIE